MLELNEFLTFSGVDDFSVGAGGVPDPIFIGLTNLVRVELGYTSNFTFLGLLEVP